MELLPSIAVTVPVALLAILLRKYLPEQALLLALGAGTLILLKIMTFSTSTFQWIKDLLNECEMPGEYTDILFKSLGICLITQLASDTCRDAGEQALATKAELGGRMALLMVGFPLFHKVAETVLSLMGQG